MGQIATGKNICLTVFLFVLAIVPFLALETPRLLAYIPAVCFLLSLPFVSFSNFKMSKNCWFALAGLILFFGYITLHSFLLSVSEDAQERLVKAVPLIIGGLLFIYTIRFLPPFNAQKLLKFLFVGAAFGAAFIAFEVNYGAPVYQMIKELNPERTFTMSVYNRSALIVMCVFLTSYFLLENKKEKWIYLFFVPFLWMVFSAHSQSVQLGFFVALILWGLFSFCPKFWAVLGLGLFAAHALALPFVIPSIYDHVPHLYDISFFKNSYANQRLEIWEFIGRKIQENPVYGFGLEFTKNFEDFDARGIYFNREGLLHPHNSVLQIWIELGVVGVAFLITFVGFLIKNAVNLQGQAQKTALIMIFTFLLLNSFSYGIWQGWWIGLMFVVAGLILLVSHQRTQYKES